MLNDLLPVHNAQYNPLATPPPDDNALAALDIGTHSGEHPQSARPRLTLSFLDDLRLLNPQQQQPPPSADPSATLAYTPQQQSLSGIPPSANTSAAAPFRYGRSYDTSSAVSGGGSNAVYDQSVSASAFGAPGVAASATSVSGYPSSPPPSRHRSDNGCDNDIQSGSTRFTSQSPVDSPVAQNDATGLSDRLNLTYGTASSQSQPPSQAHEHYPAQQSSQILSQRQTSHYAHLNSQPSLSSHTQSHSTVHSQSDRFPSVSSMLSSADRYPQRLDKYTFPPPPHPDRRMSEPSSHHTYGSSRQYAPQAVQLNSAYSAPQASYSLHRVNRSDSYSDLASGPGMAAGSEWQEDEREKHVLSRDGRPSTGNLDPYSPIASTFSSSTSSITTGSLPSPHTTQSGYSTAPGGGYTLYPSPEDAYNDGRPQSSSGDSSSPSYPYGSLPSTQSTAQHSGYGDPSSKTYSFVSLPGNTVRKRPRRRYDEIERLYACSFPGCTKAYGTLNHLNAHVNMQKHGAKRHPNEFKEMRKQWRKMKKEQEAEREARRQSEGMAMAGSHNLQDLMRRRRATEPSLYGLSSVGTEGLNTSMVSMQGNMTSVHDQGDLQGIDSSYGLPMNVGMDSLNSMGSTNNGMGLSGGYGHHHYAQSTTYHQQRHPVVVSPISPVSPTSPSIAYSRVAPNGSLVGPLSMSATNTSTAASAAYYDSIAHSQQGHESQRLGASSPPPINRLPPDSTLLTPLHSQSSHPSMGGQGYQTGLPSLSSITRMDHHSHHHPQ